MTTTDTKTVFLTGASSGINLAIAKHFADLGMNISILARNVGKLTAAKKEIEDRGAKCLIFPADVRNYCLLYTSPSPRDEKVSRMPSSA